MRLGVLLVAALLASPVAAKTKFESLETREPVVMTGDGGTKVTKNGIDYWTSGSPPRRHQVLGVIKDNRENHWLSGSAIGSKAVAKLVREAGGDAVVILGQNERVTGTVSGGQSNSTSSATGTCYGYQCTANANGQTNGYAWSADVTEVSTQMVVVKYLTDETAPQ